MQFKCFGVSENKNSFGLREMRLLDKRGHFYTACANDLYAVEYGAVIDIPCGANGAPQFGKMQFEIPERKYPDAPKDVIEAVWAM